MNYEAHPEIACKPDGHPSEQFDSAIDTITEQILEGQSLYEVLDLIYKSFHQLIPYDRMGFALVEEDGKTIRSNWACSNNRNILLQAGYSAPLAGSTLQPLVRTGRVRIINDLQEYLENKPDSKSTQLIVAEGIRSSLTCPVLANGKPVGVLFFSSCSKDTYRDAHVANYQKIALRVGLMLEKCRLYEQLLKANEEKNRFLGLVAHDLRSPLSVILGYTGILQKMSEDAGDCTQSKILLRIVNSCRTMLQMADGLLDITVIESGRIELNLHKTDIRALLLRWHEGMELLARDKSIHFILKMPDALPLMQIDPVRIEQALNNVASNAIKYSPLNSEITARIVLSANEIQVSIEDHGSGIPELDKKILFKDFGVTAAKPTGGEKSTGLGLAIARRMVEAHGGRIWVESNQHGGATFIFSLPLQPVSVSM